MMHPNIAWCSSTHVQKPVMMVVVVCARVLWSTTDIRKLAEETKSQVQVFVGCSGRGTVLLSEGGV